jgi:hypothetical protein
MAKYYALLLIYTFTFLLCTVALLSNAWFRLDNYYIGLGKLCGDEGEGFKHLVDLCWVWKTALFLGGVAVALQAIGFLGHLGGTWKFKRLAFFVTLLFIIFKIGTLFFAMKGFHRIAQNPKPRFHTIKLSWGTYLWTIAIILDLVLVVWEGLVVLESHQGENSNERYDNNDESDYEDYRFDRSIGHSNVNNQDRNRKLFEQLYAWYSTDEPFYSRRQSGGYAATLSNRSNFSAVSDDSESFTSLDEQVDEHNADAFSYYRSRQGAHTRYGSI